MRSLKGINTRSETDVRDVPKAKSMTEYAILWNNFFMLSSALLS